MTSDDTQLVAYLERLFPDPKCALHFSNPFECLCAVMLSAQTTDDSVNKVTPGLFRAFPDAAHMAKAEIEEVETIIRSIGLYRNKAKNLVLMAQMLVERHHGQVPDDKEALRSLPGVGVKTANVVGALCFNIPAIAVDTHVARVSTRLGYAKEGTEPVAIEAILEKRFPKELHIKLHHQMIWFGRTVCHARNPECANCELTGRCRYFKKNSSK